MTQKPLVTIVTPSYNQGEFVEATIKSVLNQTYPNIEYIFVDGESSDNTMQIVEKYKDKIDSIIHEKDKGQTDAINKGFKLANGELVGWINSDDILYPDCVERIVDLYLNNLDGSIFYHSFIDLIDENGNIIKTYQHIIPNKLHLLKENYSVIQQGSFYNKEYVIKNNFLDVNNFYCMDLDLWLGLLNYGDIYCTKDKSHSGFRIYDGTKTSTGQEKFLKNILHVLLKHNAKYYYKTIYYKIYFYRLKVVIKKLLRK